MILMENTKQELVASNSGPGTRPDEGFQAHLVLNEILKPWYDQKVLLGTTRKGQGISSVIVRLSMLVSL